MSGFTAPRGPAPTLPTRRVVVRGCWGHREKARLHDCPDCRAEVTK